MKKPDDAPFTTRDARELYSIPLWGAGYFDVDASGDLTCRVPGQEPVSLRGLVEELTRRGHSLPLILRFPQILEDRLDKLNAAFQGAIEEAEYGGGYQGVYPIKVNQRRVVVETLAEYGARYRTGLEAGSKAELALILVQDIHEDALICCNGFKDDDFIRMALWGRRLGKNVVLTLEKSVELDRVLRVSEELGVEPAIGVRYKLHSKGAGKWETSGGDDAKFGLTTTELMRAVLRLRAEGREGCLKMLHCHLGSQITDIRRIKVAVREATQTYVELCTMGVQVPYLNLGGGLAVDYDGSKTNFHASANYSLQEYADTVVWTVAEVCNEGEVSHPTLVSESGRALTAHHAVFVAPVVDCIDRLEEGFDLPPYEGENQDLVEEMQELLGSITSKNYREVFHEAVSNKDTMHSLYDLGYFSLLGRAHVERLYYLILQRVARVVRNLDYVPEELEVLPHILAKKYVANFSVFQAIPDHWAIQALFPIVPLHRLDEEPTADAGLVDISCDSDGKVSQFIDLRDVKVTLPLHPLVPGEPYFLGIFLTGAYQDVLANAHNLFGRVNEAHIRLSGAGFEIERFVPGQKARRVIENMGYETRELHRWLLETISEADVKLPKGKMREFIDLYDRELVGYTYLEDL